MMKLIRRIPGNKGVTLIELIIAMLVMAVIMVAATTVFAPMLQAYQRANNLAEVNTLLDNISALIMSDVASATEIFEDGRPTAPPILPNPDIPAENLNILFSIRTTHFIDYYIDNSGILWRDAQSLGEPLRLLPLHFYKFWGDETVFTVIGAEISLEEDDGIVTLTLTIQSSEGWSRDRIYTSRPIGLVPVP
ncbi:MAG: prepilin-type N-terminal cleavage/methylation domain-containing protein [Oscillospiraceae bacterium]|nr:prepilin-type N-terminal cleavage/methylation domain-containing protein [Oscillospiraceae bacterium]